MNDSFELDNNDSFNKIEFNDDETDNAPHSPMTPTSKNVGGGGAFKNALDILHAANDRADSSRIGGGSVTVTETTGIPDFTSIPARQNNEDTHFPQSTSIRPPIPTYNNPTNDTNSSSKDGGAYHTPASDTGLVLSSRGQVPERHRPDSSGQIEHLHRMRRGLGTPSSPNNNTNSRISTPLQHATRRRLSGVDTDTGRVAEVPPTQPATANTTKITSNPTGSAVKASTSSPSSKGGEKDIDVKLVSPPTTTSTGIHQQTATTTHYHQVSGGGGGGRAPPPRSPLKHALSVEPTSSKKVVVRVNVPSRSDPLTKTMDSSSTDGQSSQQLIYASSHSHSSSLARGDTSASTPSSSTHAVTNHSHHRTSSSSSPSWSPVLTAVGATTSLFNNNYSSGSFSMMLYPSMSSLTRLPGAARSRGGAHNHLHPVYFDRPTTASKDLIDLNSMRDALERDANEVRSIVTLEHSSRSDISREEMNLWKKLFLIPHDKEMRYFHHVYLAKQTRREAEQKHNARISALMLQSKSQHAEEKLKRREKREEDLKKTALAIQQQTAKQQDERQLRQEVEQSAVDETTSLRRADVTNRMRNARLESILDKRSHATQQKQYLAEESAQRVLARVDEKRRKKQLVKDVKKARELQSPSAFLRLPPLEKCAVAVIQRISNTTIANTSSSAPSKSSSRTGRNNNSRISISYALVEDVEMKAVNRDVCRIWAAWQASQGTQQQSSSSSALLRDGGGLGVSEACDRDVDIFGFCNRDPISTSPAPNATTTRLLTNGDAVTTAAAFSPLRSRHGGPMASTTSCSGGTQTATIRSLSEDSSPSHTTQSTTYPPPSGLPPSPSANLKP